MMEKVILNRGREYATVHRHPWIFSGAIHEVTGSPTVGETVVVCDAKGTRLGYGSWSPASQIRVRMLSFSTDVTPDAAFVRRRVAEAVARRSGILAGGETNACRLVNAESDGLPGVVADVYGGTAVVQLATAGAEFWKREIAAGEEELTYLYTVLDALSRAATLREIGELRQELEAGGYLRRQNSRQKPPAPLGPMEFTSDDGFAILVGRNNLQNDRLTLRTARGCDIWLHVKNIPGSHVVVITGGQTPPDRTLEQAAVLAATYSKAADSVQVPVDYTAVRHVHKPSGARPGMVIYDNQSTAYVDPDRALAARLAVKNS